MKKFICTFLLLTALSTSCFAQYTLDYFPAKPTLKNWVTFLAKDKLQGEDGEYPWQEMVNHFLSHYKGGDCENQVMTLPGKTWTYRVTFNRKYGYFKLSVDVQLPSFVELAVWNLNDGGKEVVVNMVELEESPTLGTEGAIIKDYISSWVYKSQDKYLMRQVPNNDLFQDLLEEHPNNMFELPYEDKNIKFDYETSSGVEYMQELVLDRNTGLWSLGRKYTHQ